MVPVCVDDVLEWVHYSLHQDTLRLSPSRQNPRSAPPKYLTP
jgi:hypothetical protein